MKRSFWVRICAVALGVALFTCRAGRAADDPKDDRKFDLSKDHVLYCVGYAHLDTQWRWDYVTTIDEFIRNTLNHNFERFEKYPNYVFNFTGTARYAMMKEYYPEQYAKLKKYIAEGRWHVSGSCVDEGDVNVPAPESVIRHVLYSNRFFRQEFGKESVDYMLPDCFGFPACMPSVLAHCGLKGFSSQKLSWGSAVGIPFNIGIWVGPDGKSVAAALNPGSYASAIDGRVDTNKEWVARVKANGEKYGVWADFHYYGVGDVGGAPREKDVANYVASLKNDDSQIKVALTSSDQFFRDLTDAQRAKLPRYTGDLLLTEHSAGTLTSEAYMKRWNRKNEQLADAAERAAVAADWLGGAKYPIEKLATCWRRVLGSQMHDMLPGTAIARAYPYCWNDEIIAMNGFAAVLTDSAGAVTRSLDTRGEGKPLIVYNPLAIERSDPVEATVLFPDGAPTAIRVFGPDGVETPSQELRREGNRVTVLFLAKVPSVGFAVFDVRRTDAPFKGDTGLKAKGKQLENGAYKVTLNDAGDISSIVDKSADNRELLAEPSRLVFTHEKPANWPAWNMDWTDRQKPPVGYVDGPAEVRVVEDGPVRVSLEVRRKARDSIFTQWIRLSAGDAGRRVEIKNDIDWQSAEVALRASFPLTVANPKATYNLGLGTIERGNNDPKKYEVPSHEWFDLTDKSGKYGVSVLEDCKFGSDKPTDNTVRLTLLLTPGVREGYRDQHSQDWGRHDITYALYGHAGDWRDGRSEWQARRLNQPLKVFQAPSHEGSSGKARSLVRVSTDQVDIRALKKAEDGDAYIVRLQELWGRPADGVTVTFDGAITEAHEVDGQERRIGEATLKDGKLSVDLTPFSPRSFAIRVAPAPSGLGPPICTPVTLTFDTDAISLDGDRSDGRFDATGKSIPGELLPSTITNEGVDFRIGPNAAGQPNAIACKGQKIALPEGDYNRIYVLAAADEDTTGRFAISDRATELPVSCWTGFVGQYDNRVWDKPFGKTDYRCDGRVVSITTGFIKRDAIAWFCTHRHDPKGNEAYRFSYLFKYGLDRPSGARELTLPDNGKIKVFAISAVRDENDTVAAAAPLYDDFTGRSKIEMRHQYPASAIPAHEGLKSIAQVAMDRKDKYEDLSIGAPSKNDYADVGGKHGVAFRVFEGSGDYPIHPGSGARNGVLTRLNDGELARNDDDTRRCVWYNNEGRFYADLGRSIKIRKIDTYSRHTSNRAPQYFSLWGSNDEKLPAMDITKDKRDGWTLLAVVDTRPLGEGGIHGSSVKAESAALGPYRYLMWIAQDVGEGTFFTEIDVYEPGIIDFRKPRPDESK